METLQEGSGRLSAISCTNVRARDAGWRGATFEGRADKEDPDEPKVNHGVKNIAHSASSELGDCQK